MNLLITGANGVCGKELKQLNYFKLLVDKKKLRGGSIDNQFQEIDLLCTKELGGLLKDVDVLIHLAASSSVDSTWEEVLENNIIVTKNLLDAAIENDVKRVIFASSNHVVGQYELDNAPQIYNDFNAPLDSGAAYSPDSFYGVSKICGEVLGKLYTSKFNIDFLSLRIGAVVEEDNPYAYAERGVLQKRWLRESEEYNQMLNRLKAIWLSKRDFVQIIEQCILFGGAGYKEYFVTSDNKKSWLDITKTKEELEFSPKDSGDSWTELPEMYGR